jgi:hypothetical protein
VLTDFDLGVLDRVAQRGRLLGNKRVHAPLIMTPDHIEDSRDSFALELIEIQSLHKVVFGSSPFTPLRFNAADVRLQCERELKSALVHMRHGGRCACCAACSWSATRRPFRGTPARWPSVRRKCLIRRSRSSAG